jgi:NADPH:quinone reductase-like Zn-dependent oxidoreductase
MLVDTTPTMDWQRSKNSNINLEWILMKAIVCTKYGPPEVLQLKEVEKPIPKSNEVLIKIFAVVVGIEDSMQRKGKPYFGRFFCWFYKTQKTHTWKRICRRD